MAPILSPKRYRSIQIAAWLVTLAWFAGLGATMWYWDSMPSGLAIAFVLLLTLSTPSVTDLFEPYSHYVRTEIEGGRCDSLMQHAMVGATVVVTAPPTYVDGAFHLRVAYGIENWSAALEDPGEASRLKVGDRATVVRGKGNVLFIRFLFRDA